MRYGLQADLAIDEHPDLASGRLKNLAFQVGALGNRLGGFLDGAFRRACRCRPVAPLPLESKDAGLKARRYDGSGHTFGCNLGRA